MCVGLSRCADAGDKQKQCRKFHDVRLSVLLNDLMEQEPISARMVEQNEGGRACSPQMSDQRR
jgi:hypothetical protein